MSVQVLFRVLSASFIMLLGGLTSGCNQASAYTQGEEHKKGASVKVTEQVKQLAYHSFHNRFVYGSWRFTGIEVIKNELNAYIQIPEKLDMTSEQQIAYIKSRLCPAANDPLWQTSPMPEIWVHMYTFNKLHGNYAKCEKPNIT